MYLKECVTDENYAALKDIMLLLEKLCRDNLSFCLPESCSDIIGKIIKKSDKSDSIGKIIEEYGVVSITSKLLNALTMDEFEHTREVVQKALSALTDEYNSKQKSKRKYSFFSSVMELDWVKTRLKELTDEYQALEKKTEDVEAKVLNPKYIMSNSTCKSRTELVNARHQWLEKKCMIKFYIDSSKSESGLFDMQEVMSELTNIHKKLSDCIDMLKGKSTLLQLDKGEDELMFDMEPF